MKDTIERVQNIKGLPLTDLSLTAVASITDVYEDEETGKQLPVVEMEVLNQADWDKFNAPKHEANRCAMCGHGLKIACAITHSTTGNGYWIGRDCAKKVVTLARYGDLIKGATVALAQRIACDKREADFLAEHPDELTASVKPSDKDDLFGFWKRPSKFSIVTLTPPPPPPPASAIRRRKAIPRHRDPTPGFHDRPCPGPK